MKLITKSGDRVRVAESKMNKNQVVLARTIRTLQLTSTKAVSAEALSKVWDYRADGLKIQEAKDALQDEIARQRDIRYKRCSNATGDVLAENAGKYTKLLAEKTRLLAEHAARWWKIYNPISSGEDAEEKIGIYVNGSPSCSLALVDATTSAKYPYRKPRFALAGGIVGSVDFDITDDWNYYSKRYGRPKTTVENRGVLFVYPQAKVAAGEVKLKSKWHALDRFAGNWFLDVLAAEFGCTVVDKNLRRVQLHKAFSVRRERKIGNVEIYSRIVADTVYDVCAVRGKDTFHAATAKDAVRGLNKKVKSRIAFDAETLRAVFSNGKCIVSGVEFCSTGVRNFCADNGIEETATMTRSQLRSIVTKNRALNCDRYAADLAKIGIKLNCEKYV